MLIYCSTSFLKHDINDINQFFPTLQMSMKILVILLFLLYIGILIFTEKITNHHHAYNRCSETIHMNLVTCLNITFFNKIWRSVSNKFSIINIQILGIWHSIVLAIKKLNYLYCNALSNKFSKYKAEWNIVKMNHRSRNIALIIFFISVANLTNFLCYRFEIT